MQCSSKPKETELQKQFRIKVAGMKRIHREYDGYKKEEVKQQEKVAKMEAEGQDIHDIKKQKEVLAETAVMFPNVIQRLQDQVFDVESFIEQYEENPEIKELETLKEAKESIIQMRVFIDENQE